jgi:hypothetical protein
MKGRMGPLDHDSIEKMLMTWVRSKAVTEEYQGVAVLITALNEYFFYGKDVFEDKRIMIVDLVNKLGWDEYVNFDTFPTYDDLCLRFKKSSSKCASFEANFGVQSGLIETPSVRSFYLFLNS